MEDIFSNENWINDSNQVSKFHRKLLVWGKENFRYYPWRNSSGPYSILIAEIMLHRTQASQVCKVYEPFISKYPTLSSLSQASLKVLHEELKSIGLRWRINHLYFLTQKIMDERNGKIPKSKSSLVSFPGVSNYIASAVRCFAWNYPESLADTNTIRIVGRLFNLEVKPSSRRNNLFLSLLNSLLSRENPKYYNYALLDLAAMICTKRSAPICQKCPIIEFCKNEQKQA